MSIEDNKVNTRRVLEEMWNQGNFAGFEKLCAPNYIHRDPIQPTAHTQADLKRWVTEMRNAFAGLRVSIEDLVAEGEEVMARWTLRGTQTGNLTRPISIPATGNQVNAMGITIFGFTGGKIVEDWSQLDYFNIFQQLGALPTPQAAR